MNIREVANLGATDLFGIVKIALYIVFVAVILATPFIVAKRVNVDLIALIKKLMDRGNENKRARYAKKKKNDEEYAKGYRRGFSTSERDFGEDHPCENRICDKNAGEDGAVIKHRNGSRKIVCAECAAAYLKTGYTLELSWGEEFLSGCISLIFVGAATSVLNPTHVLAASTFIENLFIFLLVATISIGLYRVLRRLSEK